MRIWRTDFTIFHSKLKIGQISPKTKIVLDLLEYLRASKFEGKKNEYDSNISRFYIQNINLDKLLPELKSD